MVLGGCNSANLIDGLDGLLSGVTGIALIGLALIGMMLLPEVGGDSVEAATVFGGGPNRARRCRFGGHPWLLATQFQSGKHLFGRRWQFDVGLFGCVHHFDVG